MAKKKSNQKSGKKAGIIAFGATLLAYALLFPFRRLTHLIIGGAVALGVAKLVQVMASPMKGLETKDGKAVKQEPQLKVDLPEDQRAKEVVVNGLELLEGIRQERDAIDEYVFTRRLEELDKTCKQMLQIVAEDPDKAGRLRKFLNYYLPTTQGLLEKYRTSKNHGVSYSEISMTRENIVHALDKILQASQKQLDAMHKDDLMDISTEIDVLEQMMMRDGYMESKLTEALRERQQELESTRAAQTADAPTATSAQLNQGAPVLNVPNSAENPFQSFYDKSSAK
ncbi:MAG: 5-bromo-4-chloroindolyl phosphate hydrolysis family protein [Clostridia bacterium]|nr:5-bromo-4-chloroindolyl phosphate hydrolysis family protein [Clostridia bacterium]